MRGFSAVLQRKKGLHSVKHVYPGSHNRRRIETLCKKRELQRLLHGGAKGEAEKFVESHAKFDVRKSSLKVVRASLYAPLKEGRGAKCGI